MNDDQFREFMHAAYRIRNAVEWAAFGVWVVAIWTAALVGTST